MTAGVAVTDRDWLACFLFQSLVPPSLALAISVLSSHS